MKTFVLYTRQACPYCHAAARLLEQTGNQYSLRPTDDHPQLLTEMSSRYNWKTVPLILEVLDGGSTRFIGGYDDLQEYLSSGKQLLKG